MEIGINLEIRGRLINRRRAGRAAFFNVLSNNESIQIYANVELENFEELLHLRLGSFVRVSGETFLTRTNHPTIRAEVFEVLHTPDVALPPVRETEDDSFGDYEDVELIRRRRYIQTIMNSDERNTFILRSRLINLIRNFLVEREYLEVETPILQPIYGGAEASPFNTRHNALDTEFYLRIAPELYLRRMIIGGYERVFEIGRNFRNEGISNRHNPEFTFMECYTSFEDYRYSISMICDLLTEIAREFGSRITYNENEIDLANITTIRYRNIVVEHGGNRDMSDSEMVEYFERVVEPTLLNPTIVYDYPACVSPLALTSSEDPNTAERFELFIGGMEIGNAYSELNNVESHIRNNGDADQDFIEALSHGMPPCTGIGLGIDRIVMLLTNRNIRDVIYFPARRI